ncbi:peptidylprolyl isomerase [Sphingomonas jejuensis]|uniref:Peptidyl-prolyl cis-trans isomerase n=1 Tax=Sphingomonas jejuensis TaxID=904715 RepID=A0ABX0XJM4_9SPHN|nr:peptidylprolyl isomerase [Sphingomonas jejuensis]NJC33067.1 peptidylprolyl isomerase [Sphingomonas jejuensis]
MRLFGSLIALSLAVAAPAHAQGQRQAPPPSVEELSQQEEARRTAERIAREDAERPAATNEVPAATPDNIWVLDLSNGQRVTVQLRPDKAPNHVERIKTLTRQGFYNGLTFHRVIDGFMAQGGDPEGTGQGGSQLPDLVAEFNDMPHVRGTVSAARTNEPNTANSQFFIVLMPRLSLDNNYTAFGRVLTGMQGVDAIAKGEPPAEPTRIARAYIQADGVPDAVATLAPPAAAPAPAPGAPTIVTVPLPVQRPAGASPSN